MAGVENEIMAANSISADIYFPGDMTHRVRENNRPVIMLVMGMYALS